MKELLVSQFIPDTDNQRFQLALQLVNLSARNIYLTGKAGTGKTTFLKYISENCLKQKAIVAPTGVAAINAGGVTLHSFFQLPLTPFIPDSVFNGFSGVNDQVANKHSLLSRLRLNSEKRKLLRELELLIIDEISMVRADTLDAIDTVLRFIRNRPASPFGGVQVLFIGDMLQLPPVIKEEEWKLLNDYYKGPFFFNAKVLELDPPLYIEFEKIYRQKDEHFISLLNQVRNNWLDSSGRILLEQCFKPSFKPDKKEGYIILTTHNGRASEINANALKELNSKLFTYEAKLENDFSERAYPAEKDLQLKVGAQVMFIRNDSAEKGKRFFNGKIGTVSGLEDDKIFVRCENESEPIEVQKEKWENIKYTINKTSRQLETELLGSFTQFPLRLAWAITIHKSQGLTFEKAIIDAGSAFAPGQVYVALSRCTNLSGLVLHSRIQPGSVYTDKRILEFLNSRKEDHHLKAEMDAACREFNHATIINIFSFNSIVQTAKELSEFISLHQKLFNNISVGWALDLYNGLVDLQETATKFQFQLKSIFGEEKENNISDTIHSRVTAASKYFIPLLIQKSKELAACPVTTDSAINAKECNDLLRDLHSGISLSKYVMEGLLTSIEIGNIQKHRKGFKTTGFFLNVYAGASTKVPESPHPLLYNRLKAMRDSICDKKDLPVFMVAGTSTLSEMAACLPQSITDLKKISGFGEARARQYGKQFLDIISNYCEEHNYLPRMDFLETIKVKKIKTSTRKKKGDTHTESFKLFKQGKSIAEIASERNLTQGTISNHLCRFIKNGELPLTDLVSEDKVSSIEKIIARLKDPTLSAIRAESGNEISFDEIRFVLTARMNESLPD